MATEETENKKASANTWTADEVKLQLFLAGAKVWDGKTYKTEKSFAKEVLKIDFSTLWRWKQKEGFWDVVMDLIPEQLKQHVFEIDLAQAKKAKAGDIQSAKYVRSVVGRPVVEKIENTGTIKFERNYEGDDDLADIVARAAEAANARREAGAGGSGAPGDTAAG